MSAQKRRSDRLMLTVPLRVQGMDASGDKIKADGRTLVLNRHGAKIQLAQKLATGSTVRIVNLTNRREADFRVVGPTAPPTDKGGEWGVEYVSPNEDIWGIRFPPTEGEVNEAAALLECRVCNSAVMTRLSLVEVEVLDSSGILNRLCEHCDGRTPWSYAEKQLIMDKALPSEPRVEPEEGGPEKRRHRRVALQMPVRIRDYQGGTDISKSDNVSKGGFSFVSEKDYTVGAGVMVACPYSPTGQSPEVHARIVRMRPVPGTNRKIYGVSYDRESRR